MEIPAPPPPQTRIGKSKYVDPPPAPPAHLPVAKPPPTKPVSCGRGSLLKSIEGFDKGDLCRSDRFLRVKSAKK